MVVTKMDDETIFIKKGDEKTRIERSGKVHRLMVKSDRIETIITELDPHAKSKWFQHTGEELHLIIQGKLEYTVGEKSYRLNEGDILWHRSDARHRAKNIGSAKVKYITIGTPPTFMMSDL